MANVVLVDTDDNEVGTMEKMRAHQTGTLHRALSILLFNSRNELLLQQRAYEKYHSGGLWSNTCCSHPLPGEPISDAARRCLRHEMGIDVQPDFSYKFIYHASLDAGLQEHELDYVFTGRFDGEPALNGNEVKNWKFMDLQSVRNDILHHPQHYTFWFKLMIKNPVWDSFVS